MSVDQEANMSAVYRGVAMKTSVMVVLAAITVNAGCRGGQEPIDHVATEIAGLTDAIKSISANLGAYPIVLADLEKRLVAGASSTLRNEVTNLARSTVSMVGVESRCDADFIGKRVVRVLETFLARIEKRPEPIAEPHVCNVTPPNVDLRTVKNRQSEIAIFGFDLPTQTGSGIRAFVVSTAPNGNTRVDVTQNLAHPSSYEARLNVVTDIEMDASSRQIVFQWLGRDFSSVNIIPPNGAVRFTYAYFGVGGHVCPQAALEINLQKLCGDNYVACPFIYKVDDPLCPNPEAISGVSGKSFKFIADCGPGTKSFFYETNEMGRQFRVSCDGVVDGL